MVALITTSSLHSGQPVGTRVASYPQLRLIRGGLDAPERVRSVLVMVAAVLAVLAAVIGLRMVQGQPPAMATGSAAPAATTNSQVAAGAQAGEAQRLVIAGDTLWAIAEDLAPGRDPRPIVDALADRNGGSALRAGDMLVIPAELLGIPDGQLVPDSLDVVAAGEFD